MAAGYRLGRGADNRRAGPAVRDIRRRFAIEFDDAVIDRSAPSKTWQKKLPRRVSAVATIGISPRSGLARRAAYALAARQDTPSPSAPTASANPFAAASATRDAGK